MLEAEAVSFDVSDFTFGRAPVSLGATGGEGGCSCCEDGDEDTPGDTTGAVATAELLVVLFSDLLSEVISN